MESVSDKQERNRGYDVVQEKHNVITDVTVDQYDEMCLVWLCSVCSGVNDYPVSHCDSFVEEVDGWFL